jgi:hypothetical protein
MDGIINIDYNTVKVCINTLPGVGGLLITTNQGDDGEIQNTFELNTEGILIKSEDSSIFMNDESIEIKSYDNIISMLEDSIEIDNGDTSIKLSENSILLTNDSENTIEMSDSGISMFGVVNIDGDVTINDKKY